MIFDPVKLQQAVEAQGRRVDWLADMTEYDRATVSRFLSGTYPISEKFATRAARALGIPVDWLRADIAVPA